jgi:hypothetical protein
MKQTRIDFDGIVTKSASKKWTTSIEPEPLFNGGVVEEFEAHDDLFWATTNGSFGPRIRSPVKQLG